ncbi:YbaN family protein [Ilumatobacter sp.]|uniref:YbaN family protein n=1 Tax=Ilumatobacter sp. TaxID=1967498 RepID=UPI003AF65A21
MRSPIALLRRGLWVVAGLVCVGLGALGVVLPGLPFTVFFIGAAACFARSSPRLERWVLDLPKIGTAVERYRAGLGMPLRAKRWAVACIVGFSSLSAVLVGSPVFAVGVLTLAAIGVWYVTKRVPTTPAEALDAVNA